MTTNVNVKDQALKLAEWITLMGTTELEEKAATMLRQQAKRIEELEKVLVDIANDYPELSHDKARMQNLDHIKWAKEVLK